MEIKTYNKEKLDEMYAELKFGNQNIISIDELPSENVDENILYYLTTNETLYHYKNNEWIKIGGDDAIIVANVLPTIDIKENVLYYLTTNETLYHYKNGKWLNIGGEGIPHGENFPTGLKDKQLFVLEKDIDDDNPKGLYIYYKNTNLFKLLADSPTIKLDPATILPGIANFGTFFNIHRFGAVVQGDTCTFTAWVKTTQDMAANVEIDFKGPFSVYERYFACCNGFQVYRKSDSKFVGNCLVGMGTETSVFAKHGVFGNFNTAIKAGTDLYISGTALLV